MFFNKKQIRKKINTLEVETLELKVARKILIGHIKSLHSDIEYLTNKVEELQNLMNSYEKKGE